MSAIVIYENDGSVLYDCWVVPTTGPFPIDFPYFFADEIHVYKVVVGETPDLLLVQGVEYTLVGVPADDGFHSGTVTLTSTVVNCQIRIDRYLRSDKAHNFPETGAISIPGMNTLFSRLFSWIQDLKRWVIQQLGWFEDRIETIEVELDALQATAVNTAISTAETMGHLKVITVRPEAIWLEGYWGNGDGGSGWWYWEADSTTPPDDATVVFPPGTPLGRYKRAIEGGIYDVRWFGCRGDGTSDDTAAFNAAALAAAGHTLRIPAGYYQLKHAVVQANTKVICEGGAILRPFDTVDLTSANSVVELRGSDIDWSGGRIEMPISTTYGLPPAGYYGLYVTSLPGIRTVGLRIRNLTVVGGREGVWIPGTVGSIIENVEVSDQYEWGIAFPLGPTGFPGTEALTCRTIRARRVGLYEGFKIASVYQATSGTPHHDIVLEDLLIEDCGRLDPTPANWQEGLDLFVGAAQRIRVSNFTLRRNGNGGIELKYLLGSGVSSDYLEYVTFENGYIEVNYDLAGGIALNHAAATAPSSKISKIMIDSVNFNYAGPAAPAGAAGIGSVGLWGLAIENCRFDGQFTQAVNLSSGTGTTDELIVGVRVANCVGESLATAIYFASGAIDNVLLSNNTFVTSFDSILFAGSLTSCNDIKIHGGWYEAGNNRVPINMGENCTLVDIAGTTLVGTGTNYCILITGAASSGLIHNCILRTGGDAVRIDSPLWDVFDNRLILASDKVLALVNASLVNGWDNVRGHGTSAPGTAGAIGEVFKNKTPTAAGVKEWVCTTAGGPGAAVWTPLPLP